MKEIDERNIDWEGSLNSLMVACWDEFPDFKVRYKDESKFMKLISFFLFFSKGFRERVSTTINKTVYFPSRAYFQDNPRRAFFILLHEREHMRQAKRHGFIPFALGYLFPQCLALLSLLALLAFAHPGFLVCLAFLAFLAPLPAPLRYRWEREGYRMNILIRVILYGDLRKNEIDHMISNLYGWKYFFMNWDRVQVVKNFETDRKLTVAGLYAEEEVEVLNRLKRFED